MLDSGLNILRDDPGEVEISSLDDLGRVEDNIYTAGSDAGTDTLGSGPRIWMWRAPPRST